MKKLEYISEKYIFKKQTLKFLYSFTNEELMVYHLFENRDGRLDMETRMYPFKKGDYITISTEISNRLQGFFINFFEDSRICINKLISEDVKNE